MRQSLLSVLRDVALGLVLVGAVGATTVRAEVDVLSDDYYGEQRTVSIDDPLEPFNRVMFAVNDALYDWLVRPVTSTYAEVVPADLRGCVTNFFHNLEEPLRVVNALLQGRFDDASRTGLRFAINSVFGVYGLADPAAREFGLSPVEASLDQTLAGWQLGYGSYLFLPLWGPGTLRELASQTVEGYGTPYFMWTDNLLYQGAVYSGKEFNELSFHLQDYDDLRRLTIDPYLAVRNGYAQYYADRLRPPVASVPSSEQVQ